MASPTGVSPKGIARCLIPGDGAPSEEQASIPFTEGVIADELPVNCRTPAITEHDAPPIHRSTCIGLRMQPCCTDTLTVLSAVTFAWATKQWFS
ncbi:UNVERIFIED_CONTAM: hypothetical protein Slati_2159200 [Sesamum latifolium]|uniref:Uncharacterized protein n=1 Tax=Sesamum latifolium TaxID=2727402 RepID=A0AAW2WSF4_9LAMI